MPFDDEVDLVVLGAGCAGLSLLAQLADAATPVTALALESRDTYVDDRSWCFWRPDSHDLDHLVTSRWPAWTFSAADGRRSTRSVEGMSYQYIRGADFYADARARIAAAPGIEIRTGVAASEPVPVEGGVLVEAGGRSILARFVVDTRPRPTPALLYQCFAGAEVESSVALDLDLETAGLMTDMTAGPDGLAFTYVLPFTPTRALIEVTRFSSVPLPREHLEAELEAELAQRGLAAATVVRREGGTLPMGRPPRAEETTPGVVLAGTGGGALRAASGYAFLRIQEWARACAESIAAGSGPIGHPAEPWDRREMDRIFLQAVRAHPEQTANYFMALADRVPPHRLVRFLSDGATAGDYAWLIATLPLFPFLAQIPRRPELFVQPAAEPAVTR